MSMARRKEGERFPEKVGLRNSCVMSSWQFNLFHKSTTLARENFPHILSHISLAKLPVVPSSNFKELFYLSIIMAS